MICPECHIDQQRVKLPWHMVQDHDWPADKAEDYYLEQIDKLLRETK